MAAPCESTKELLISLVNDIELLSKEVFEEATSSHANRLATKGESSKVAPVLEALVKQDEKLQKTLKKAKEQAVVQQRIDILNNELDKKNGEILSLQKNLKEAETLLASAVYEAKKKLASINKAEEKAVSADDLIRFAHRISASGAVAAPSTWVPGDPSRRPYPTDAEMRQGYMAKPYDKLRESLIHQASQPASHTPSASNNTQVETPSTSFPYSWQTQTSLDTPTFMSSGTSSLSHQMNMKQNQDVEIMSQSDTSSNSSNSNSDDEQ